MARSRPGAPDAGGRIPAYVPQLVEALSKAGLQVVDDAEVYERMGNFDLLIRVSRMPGSRWWRG